MKVIFAGTPEFARVALDSLHAAGFEIPLVLTQPDRPAGRGMKLQASPVKQWASERKIALAQPRSLRLDGKFPDDASTARHAIEAAQPDVMVVAAYGIILPQWVLQLPRLGCINIHASLLPRWRGAAPIHRAVEAGDSETGITIMQMDEGLDTGDMLLVEKMMLTPADTTESLHDKLASLGGRLIVDALQMAARSGFHATPQPSEGVTYAHKIEKHEALIDWHLSATAIERRIRAFNPSPGAFTVLGSDDTTAENIKVREAVVLSEAACLEAAPGEIVAANELGIDVATASGVLRVVRLQKAGGKALAAADFLRGFELHAGMVFSSTRPQT